MRGYPIAAFFIIATITWQLPQTAQALWFNEAEKATTPNNLGTTILGRALKVSTLPPMRESDVPTESAMVSTQRTSDLGDFSQPSTEQPDPISRYAMDSTSGYPNRMSSLANPRIISSSANPRRVSSSANPRTESSSSNPRIESSSADPRMVSSPANPRTESSPANPRMVSSSANPRIESSSTNPRMVSSSANPIIESSSVNPRIESSSANPRMVSSSDYPRMEVRSANPRMMSSSDYPRMEVRSANPRMMSSSAEISTSASIENRAEGMTTVQTTIGVYTTTKFDWRKLFVEGEEEKVTPFQRPRQFPPASSPNRTRIQWKEGFPRTEDSHVTCTTSPRAGYCFDKFSAWYFNPQTSRCQWFQYSGCSGNANRFASRAACDMYCIDNVQDMCSVAVCNKFLKCKLYEDKLCVQEGIDSERDLRGYCPPKQPVCAYNSFMLPARYPDYIAMRPPECLEAPDRGTCSGERQPVQRYYFDNSINTCKYFYYSQCGGGNNRFFTKEECMNHCAI